MFTTNGKSDIVRQLSNLRLNSKASGRDSNNNDTYRSLPCELLQPQTETNNEVDLENSRNLELNDFNPFDSESYPKELIEPGLEMIRVTRRKLVKRRFRLDLSDFSLKWNTKQTSKLEIGKIKSIRIGDEARNYREQLNVSQEFQNLWITIIYTSTTSMANNFSLVNSLKTLHIIAPNRKNYKILTNTLKRLHEWSRNQESLMNCANVLEFSTIKWNNKVKRKQNLTFEELLAMCDELHISMDAEYLKKYLRCRTKEDLITFKDFQTLIVTLRERSELINIFSELGICGSRMDKLKFYQFVKDVQQEELSYEFIDTLFERFSFNRNNKYLTINGLGDFLTSEYCSPCTVEDIDESYYSLPLTDYFVASSHNTYLLGKQVHGYSSIEGYINALQKGCKCIEIDIWNNPGSSTGSPIVTHGHTLTTSIDLTLVVDTIKKYAFIASPYPLIISLEINCSTSTQLKTVEIFKNTFGNMLIDQPINNESKLPSPNDLKYRILLKVKKSAMTNYNDPDIEKIHPSFSTTSSTISDSTDDSTSLNQLVRRKTRQFITPELTELAPYLIGIKFRNFSLPESKTFNHVFSFSDRSLISMMRDQIKLVSILKHNRRGLMRVYPSIIRYNSNNFNPIPFWEVGCQFVATNWQLWDCGQEISQSLFKKSGLSDVKFSGYRLKPRCMRLNGLNEDKQELKLKLLKNLEKSLSQRIEIVIISGQQLPKLPDSGPEYTPWVEVKFYNIKPKTGEIVDLGKQSALGAINAQINSTKKGNTKDLENPGIFKVKSVDPFNTDPHHDAVFKIRVAENMNNLFKPIWNIRCRLDYMTSLNDLSFIRIIVKSSIKSKSSSVKRTGNVVIKSPSQCIIGSWCCKLSDLKCGYRYIPLFDQNGDEISHSNIFINVKKTKLTK
ncbi:hypothetical protein CANINC_003447 [Pichia inconspicua]|uniref:Phosphoinositide phospholipase C n=1 Tax=Pichia inconspicua TaxID=52247 RepID=A0A4T0X037_9ASCO|nr:hypothetical protein CANINC_003447 [[Candida] inconspicua]